MPLITDADFNTHLYPEIISAIDRDSEDILDDAIDAAEGIAKGYLSKYNITTLFSATGSSRDKALVMHLKDMASWHFCILSNVQMNLELLKERHDDAISWLRDIQKGMIVPYGWTKALDSEGEAETYFHVTSNTKRETHY